MVTEKIFTRVPRVFVRLDLPVTLFFIVVKERVKKLGCGEIVTMDNGAIIYNRDLLGDSVSNE